MLHVTGGREQLDTWVKGSGSLHLCEGLETLSKSSWDDPFARSCSWTLQEGCWLFELGNRSIQQKAWQQMAGRWPEQETEVTPSQTHTGSIGSEARAWQSAMSCDGIPPARLHLERLHNLREQHQRGTRCSDTGAYGDVSFQTIAIGSFCITYPQGLVCLPSIHLLRCVCPVPCVYQSFSNLHCTPSYECITVYFCLCVDEHLDYMFFDYVWSYYRHLCISLWSLHFTQAKYSCKNGWLMWVNEIHLFI